MPEGVLLIQVHGFNRGHDVSLVLHTEAHHFHAIFVVILKGTAVCLNCHNPFLGVGGEVNASVFITAGSTFNALAAVMLPYMGKTNFALSPRAEFFYNNGNCYESTIFEVQVNASETKAE